MPTEPKSAATPRTSGNRSNVGRRSVEKTRSANPRRAATRVKLWGVRGSIPVPGPSTLRYGGNTSCVEVRADGEIIVLDAGSGIRPLGIALEKEFGERAIQLSLLITHAHWDHIQGLPFFLPAYKEKNEIRVRGYEGAREGLGHILATQMEPPFFPVKMRDLPSNLAIEELKATEFNIGAVRIRSILVNHPGICAGYRLFTSSGSMAYLPDNEPHETSHAQNAGTPGAGHRSESSERAKLVEFLSGADLVMLDTQYTDSEYKEHIGWGHGSLSRTVDLALDARVKKLLLFHHDPNHDDQMVEGMVALARQRVRDAGGPMEVDAAREGAEFVLGSN